MTKAEALEKLKKLTKALTTKHSAGEISNSEYTYLYNILNAALSDLNYGVPPDIAMKATGEVENAVASPVLTEEEYKKQKSAMYQKYKAGQITNYAYIQWKKANDPKLQAGKAPAAASAAPMSMTQLMELENELIKKLNASEITPADYLDKMDKLQNLYAKKASVTDAKAAVGLTQATKPAPASGMTKAELDSLDDMLAKKKKAGLITQDEYTALKGKLTAAYSSGKTVSEIEKEIGCDPGTLATDKSIIKLGKELKQVYGDAAKEIQAELDEFLKEYEPEMKELEKKFIDGTIDQKELEHLKMLTLQKGILGQKADQLTGVMLNANQKAMAMINGETFSVFAENANWQSYQLTKDTKLNLSFSIYDEDTAAKLAKDKPELLPRKEVNGKKDKAWNQKVIAGAVLQGVIQGDSIPKLAKRIAVQTGETNMKAMTRYARTAMTSAQNSGRMEMLHRAKGMGIQVKKVWMATLDSRTRDVHAKLDGEKADVDEPFKSDFGDILFPGDLSSKGSVPANLYNCRCTLVYDYEGFPNDPEFDQRIQYDEYVTEETDASGKTKKVFHRESRLVSDMTYDEWKKSKEAGKMDDLSAAKTALAIAQKAVIKAKVKEDKVYEGLWKDPVTLADYPAKKAGIQAKRDYYTQEIEKYKQAQANGASWATDDKIKELEKKRKLLNEYEMRGELVEKRDQALAAVQGIYSQVGYGKAAAAPTVAKKPAAKKAKTAAAAAPAPVTTGPFGPEAYSKDRKDKALWTGDKKKVDGMMRSRTGEVWQNATQAERAAIYEYTQSYHKFNEPLRGIEYGTKRYLGVGHTDLNAGSARNGRRLNGMTDIIDRCSYDHDMWLQRGCGFSGMDKFFQCDPSLLRNGTETQLRNALLGKTVTEHGFMSMGSAKGQGFSGDILLNIYAPKGTRMMYAEPFSAYSGSSAHLSWDGKSGQSRFGGEFETIMQQGTQFRITKVERKGRQIYVDIEVINQDHQQRWTP